MHNSLRIPSVLRGALMPDAHLRSTVTCRPHVAGIVSYLLYDASSPLLCYAGAHTTPG
jgi:hypothetical protein